MHDSGGGITIRGPAWQQQRRASFSDRTLLVPMLVEEEDDEEDVKAAKVAEYLRHQRLVSSNDDLGDCPGYNAAYMASLNDTDAWRGDIDDVITMSIRDSGMPLVDLTHNGDEVGPSGAVKDEHVNEDASGVVKYEPVDEDADPRGKKDVVHDSMYNFLQYYFPSGRRKYY
jgi:hypothetical protein